MVDVPVDDGHPFPIVREAASRDRHVVEQTEPHRPGLEAWCPEARHHECGIASAATEHPYGAAAGRCSPAPPPPKMPDRRTCPGRAVPARQAKLQIASM